MNPLRIEANSLNKIIINHRITEKCNYKCPYCYFTGRDPINLEEDYDKLKKSVFGVDLESTEAKNSR